MDLLFRPEGGRRITPSKSILRYENEYQPLDGRDLLLASKGAWKDQLSKWNKY